MENIEFTKLDIRPNTLNCKMCFKIKQDKNNNTEQIYIVNSDRDEIIYSFGENRIGTSLVSFLNNYNEIIKEFKKTINEYENTSEFNFENLYKYMKKLESNLLTIFDEARIIGITLNEFLCDMRYDFEKETYNFNLENYYEALNNNDKYDLEEMSIHYSSIRNYRNYNDNNIFYKNLWIRFLKQYEQLLKNFKTKLDRSFLSKENKGNYAKKFTGITTILPPIEVFYDENINSNYLTPIEYRYSIRNFSNFIYSSLHSIFISNKAISKCKNCGKYFITCENNTEIYCPNLDENGFFQNVKEAYLDDGWRIVVDSDCRRNAQEYRTNISATGKKSAFKNKEIMDIKGRIMDRLGRKKKNGEFIYGDLKSKFEKEFDEKYKVLIKKYPNNQEKIEDEMLEYIMLKDKEFRKRKEN